MAVDRRGRQPTVTALRVLTNPTGKRLSDKTKNAGNGDLVVALPMEGRPNYPMALKPGGMGRRFWRLYWEKAPWLAAADYPMVLRLCELWDVWASLKARMLDDGSGEPWVEVVKARRSRNDSSRDTVAHRVHPMLSSLMHVMTQMERLEGLLGLNPVDRSRIRIAGGEDQSSLDSWKKRRDSRKADRPAPPAQTS